MTLLIVGVPAELVGTDLIDTEYRGIVHFTDRMIGILRRVDPDPDAAASVPGFQYPTSY